MLRTEQYGKREREEVNRILTGGNTNPVLEEMLEYLASSHNITGLTNIRKYFEEALPAWNYIAEDLPVVYLVLSADGFKQVVKSLGTIHWLNQQLARVRYWRANAVGIEAYGLYYKNGVLPYTVYHSAHAVLSGGLCVPHAEWSWKAFKNALKNYKAIDRYASVEPRELDLPSGTLLKMVDTILANETVYDYKVTLFETSFDLCDEGTRMGNCLASYWENPFTDCYIFAITYKGERIDVEIAADWEIDQCYTKYNKVSDESEDLARILNQIIHAAQLQDMRSNGYSIGLHQDMNRTAVGMPESAIVDPETGDTQFYVYDLPYGRILEDMKGEITAAVVNYVYVNRTLYAAYRFTNDDDIINAYHRMKREAALLYADDLYDDEDDLYDDFDDFDFNPHFEDVEF